MDVESLAKQLILQGMTPEQQKAVLESIRGTMAKSRELQKQKVGEQARLVIEALKKIESDIKSRYDEVGNKIEQRVASIKDGKDGRDGTNGRDGRAGRDGSTGPMGPKGADGRNGVDGQDGVDGVSVTDAHIDFDGSLIISLSSGRTINVGEVVAPDLAEKIKVITNGGGTSQSVLDALASLQTQINNLIPSQTGNAGKFLTTDGTDLAWADVAGGLSYQGTWNASTNTPTLASSTGTNGYYYVVSVAGSTNLNGITDWQAGDWLIFNGSVWQKIDQSWAIAGANDNITSMTGITGGISSPDFIQFDTTATVTDATGKLYYTDDDQYQTLAFQMNGSVIQHVGHEIFYRVKLTAAATKGQVLMFTGTLGASGGLTAAPATGLTFEQSNYLLGVAGESGSTNDWITVYEFGEVKGVNTSAFTQGQILYYDPAVTGGLTATKPNTPNAIATIAAVVHVGTSNGVLFVRPTFGSALGATDGNVRFGTLASGNTLIYDAFDGVWKNANLTDGTGISITEGAGSITITNSAPDQTVALTAGTGISTSGTYPNFTITNSAPDQTVSLTGAGTTSISGTYPSFTVTSNDQYTGTVTSVGGTGTVNGISLSGTVTSSGNLTLGGTLSGVSLTTQVSGTLPIANGGTGQTTANAAFNALAPSQTSNSGKYLTTDGTNTSWATAGVTASNDTSTSTNLYPLFANATSGSLTTIYTGNAKLLYKPSTGELSATVPRASNGIVVNSQTISENYTIASGDNGGSFGPVTVNSGITVTVSSGSTWTVV
jgi:hypothetical protein